MIKLPLNLQTGWRPHAVLLALLPLLLYLPASHAASGWSDHVLQRTEAADDWQWVQSGGQISMQQAISIAKRQFPGRVLSAKRSVNRQGNTVYRIKILSNAGQIRTITVAANQRRG